MKPGLPPPQFATDLTGAEARDEQRWLLVLLLFLALTGAVVVLVFVNPAGVQVPSEAETPEFNQLTVAGALGGLLTIFVLYVWKKQRETSRLRASLFASELNRLVVERSYNTMQALFAVSNLINSRRPLNELYMSILPSVATQLGGEQSLLFIKDPTSDSVACVSAWGSRSERAKGALMPAQAGIVGRLRSEGSQLISSEELSNDERLLLLGRADAKGQIVAAPLHAYQKFVGLMLVTHAGESTFKPEDRMALNLFAENVGLALVNNRLREKLSGRAARLRKAYEEIKAQTEERIKAEKMASTMDLVLTLHHEVNNPLAAIVGNAQLLNEGADALPEPVREKLRIIERESVRIKQMLARLRQVTNLATTPYRPDVAMLDLERSVGDAPAAHLEGDDEPLVVRR